MSEFKLKELDFRIASLSEDVLAEEYIKDYPITYIIKNNKSAYIGETTNAKARIKSHLTNSDRKKLEKILLIGHKKFNQSATYNIETNLINYFLADQKYEIQNKSQIRQKSIHNYYNKDFYNKELFEKLWIELRKQNIVDGTTDELKNKDIYKLSPFKQLSEEQLELKEEILDFCLKNKRIKLVIGQNV